jgi:hypothetical protein
MWPGSGFLSDAWSSAKSSFKSYYTSAASAIAHPINTVKAMYNSAKQMSAGELLTAPIRNSPGVKMITAEVTAVKALVQGDGKTFGGVAGNQVANTTAVLATAGIGAVAGKAAGALSEIGVANPVPSMVARVVPTADVSATLGPPSATQTFVTGASDISGLNAAQISQRLTIPQSSSGYTIFEFPTPKGISTPFVSDSPGFVGGGRTAGGAREFNVPNQPIPPNATIRTVQP